MSTLNALSATVVSAAALPAPRSDLASPSASALQGAGALPTAAWFNDQALEESRVLRAPARPGGATAAELTATFMSCLQDSA
ncbi:MAG: hypothetical protein H7Z19_17015 [Chitinophagaceae bacterium]|nr:hypothetical protein [Rubrivivax sp.]